MLFSRFNLSQSFNYATYLFCKKQFKSEINCFCIRTQRIREYWYISVKTIQFINSYKWQLIQCTYEHIYKLVAVSSWPNSGSLHGSPPRFYPSKKVRKPATACCCWLSYFASVALLLLVPLRVSETIVGILVVVGSVAGVPNVTGCCYKASLLLFTSVMFLLYMYYCWLCW